MSGPVVSRRSVVKVGVVAAAVGGGAILAHVSDPAFDAIARYRQADDALKRARKHLCDVADAFLKDPATRLEYGKPGSSDNVTFANYCVDHPDITKAARAASTTRVEALLAVVTVPATSVPGAWAKLKLGQEWETRHGVSVRASAIEDLERLLGERGLS